MRKKLFFLVFTFLLLTTVMLQPTVTVAAETEAQYSADFLHKLGLFHGTSTDSNGDPIFELERAPSRTEALIMLVRLMGLENEAVTGVWQHPFTDVPTWAQNYVGYGYSKGLTAGISANLFGANNNATANMYVTFVLRALGYSDSGNKLDFSYSQAVNFGNKIGLIDENLATKDNFTRGDVAIISEKALGFRYGSEELTLYEKLSKLGVLKNAATWNDSRTKLTVPAFLSENGGTFSVSYQDLKCVFPEMVQGIRTTIHGTHDIHKNDKYSVDERLFVSAIGFEKPGNKSDLITNVYISTAPKSITYITDSHYRILAQCKLPEDYEGLESLVFTTEVTIDGKKLSLEYFKILDTVEENWDKNTFELGEERYETWGKDRDISSLRVVKMNGNYISDGWYMIGFVHPGANEKTTTEEWQHNAKRAITTTFYSYNPSSLDSEATLPTIKEPDAPATRGFRFGEYSEFYRALYFFAKEGVYLGMIIVPGN